MPAGVSLFNFAEVNVDSGNNGCAAIAGNTVSAA
jgi:hypothetical protein